MRKTDFLFGLIIILAIVLRFFYIEEIPNGLYSDEASYGYNAFSILETGKDEYGNFMPLAFRSFGDYKAPLYIYFLIPFIKIFGLSEWSVRVPSAVLGVGLVILIYILAQKITRRTSAALLSAYLVSISPLGLQFNRMAHENNLVAFLVTGAVLFFVLSLKKANYIILSFLTFAASIYTYHDARVLVPLLLLLFFYFYRQNLWQIKEKVVFGFIIFLLLLIPFISLFKSGALWSRPRNTIVFSDLGSILTINNERGEDKTTNYFAPFLFHNKIFSFPKILLQNYLTHFSPDFLFFSGDKVKIYNTVESGILYLAEMPFLLLGLYFLLRKNFSYKAIIFSLLLLSPIPAALTKYVPSASRMLSILPSLSIIPALGLILSIKYFKNYSKRIVYLVFISILFTINISYYLHYYYINTPIRYASDWHCGMREVIGKVNELQNRYKNIWFSKNTWGYIYPLFYLRYPPDKYQTQAKLSPLNEFGFGWVDAFDKYIFADFPNKMNSYQNTLFIGSPTDFKKLKKPLYSVYYPNGDIAYYFADSTSF